jgi:hypothetical protein
MAKINLKIIFFTLLVFTFYGNLFAQSFNGDKTAFSNYLKRMYAASPFEGVKIVDDYDHQYLISVISLDKVKYSDPSLMNRVSLVKAQSQANTFINGASITMDMVITTTEKTTKDSSSTVVQSVESIKQNSMGFTQGLELLCNFDNPDSKRMVFIYQREIIKEAK